jgi:hypothetical protein
MAIVNGFKNIITALKDTWGRSVDKEYLFGDDQLPPQSDPDTTSSDVRFDTSKIPVVEAALQYINVSRLFVSAKGLEPDENGAYFPAQLVFTSPGGDEEVMEALATQYDELFEGGFQPIIKSLEDPAITEGRCIAEIEWYMKEDEPYKGKMFARFVWSRDPDDYIFDYEGEPGIYRDADYSTIPEKMSPTSFLSYAHAPLYNNKYGNSKNRSLQPWLQSWIEVFDFWRKGLEHSGYGFIVGTYARKYAGKGADAVSWRANFLKEILAYGAGKGGIKEEGNELELQQIKMEAGLYLEWYTELKKDASLVYTGSETALVEGQYGTYAGKESGEVRERSYIEMLNAARVCGFWTWSFNRLWCAINYPPERIKVIPTLQLIPPQLVVPTTPKDQEEVDQGDGEIKTPDNIGKDDDDEEKELAASGYFVGTGSNESSPSIPWDGNSNVIFSNEPPKVFLDVSELQDKEEPTPDAVPVAVPASYKTFPDTEPIPEVYKGAFSFAEEYLQEMPVMEYNEVTADDASYVFTVKRLRNYTTDVLPVLEALKAAIIPSLDAESEADAWMEYYAAAVEIFSANGIPMDNAIRDDLNISFRQARQNALNGGVIRQAQEDPDIVGLRIINKENVDHHPVHVLWDQVGIPKNHPELALGGRLRIPMDFGCVCFYEFIYEPSQLTPESEWPEVWPGQTYRRYAPQEVG